MHIEHYPDENYPDYIDKFEDALMKIKAPKSTLGYAAAGAVNIKGIRSNANLSFAI